MAIFIPIMYSLFRQVAAAELSLPDRVENRFSFILLYEKSRETIITIDDYPYGKILFRFALHAGIHDRRVISSLSLYVFPVLCIPL